MPLFVTAFGERFFRAPQNSQRSAIFRARTHERSQSLDRFHVVIVNLGPGIEHNLDAPVLRVKIRNQHFDDH